MMMMMMIMLIIIIIVIVVHVVKMLSIGAAASPVIFRRHFMHTTILSRFPSN